MCVCVNSHLYATSFTLSRTEDITYNVCTCWFTCRDRLRRLNSPELVPSVCAYRAGYTASERRDIEGSLFRGQLRAVAATNALELGIDVGALDVTLHLGFPGTVASLWQQSGRAGRREQQALSVYIAFDGPLDQYFMLKPEKLFTASIERAIVDTRNLQIVKTHATCAAYERALLMSEAALDSEEHADDSPAFFGTGLRSAVTELRKQNLLGPNPMQPNERAFRYIGPCTGGPAKEVSMRQVEQERFKIIEELSGEVVEEIEATMAFYQVYEGAIYMNQVSFGQVSHFKDGLVCHEDIWKILVHVCDYKAGKEIFGQETRS